MWPIYFLVILVTMCGLITFFIFASRQIWDVMRRAVYDAFLIERHRYQHLIEIEHAKDEIRRQRAGMLERE